MVSATRPRHPQSASAAKRGLAQISSHLQRLHSVTRASQGHKANTTNWPPAPRRADGLRPIPGSFQLSEAGQLFVTQPCFWDLDCWEFSHEPYIKGCMAQQTTSKNAKPLGQLVSTLHTQLDLTLGDPATWYKTEAGLLKKPYIPGHTEYPEQTHIVEAAPGAWKAAVSISSDRPGYEGSDQITSLVVCHSSVADVADLDYALDWQLAGTVRNEKSSKTDAGVMIVNATAMDPADDVRYEKRPMLTADKIVSKVGPVSVYRDGLAVSHKSTVVGEPVTYCPVSCPYSPDNMCHCM